MKFYAILLAALVSLPAFAQTGEQGYVLGFNPEVSQQLIDGNLNLGSAHTVDIDGCSVAVREDGPVICFTQTSCLQDQASLPFCAFLFTSQPGLNLSDVAVLGEVSATSGAMISSTQELTPETLYRLKRR